MTNETGIFNSESGDRTYNAEDFTGFYSDFFTNGIVADNTSYLQVAENSGLKLWVLKGKAYINGGFFKPKTSKEITIPDSDPTYPRYDIVVLRWDKIARDIYLDVISGDSNTNPKYPILTRNETTYELGLAAVYVAPNATNITQDKITDLRFNDNYCGVVTGVIDTISTKNLFAQYEAEWDLLRAGIRQDEQAVIDAWSALNATKSVNDIAPIDGNVTITQGNIPAGNGAYQLPYFVQSGSATTEGEITINFTTKYTTPPVVLVSFTPSSVLSSHGYGAYTSAITANGVTIKSYDSHSTSHAASAGTVNWIALGK